MTALPIQMSEADILREHEASESRVVAESRRMPCDTACGASATLYVRVLDKKVHSHLCNEHGAQAIAAYHAAGLNVEAQLLADRAFAINGRRGQKKEQVERFLEKLGKPVTDEAPEPDDNTLPRLGCCVDCQETAYAEYKRYGRDDS
jgi:hypothetical protein